MRHANSGMSLSEIASMLGMSVRQVRDIERRAMTKLRARVGSSYDGPIWPFLDDAAGRNETQKRQPRRLRQRDDQGRYARG